MATTTFIQQCEQVADLANQLQRALDGLKPQLGDLPNNAILQIANTVTKQRGAPRPAAPANPAEIDAAFAQDTNPTGQPAAPQVTNGAANGAAKPAPKMAAANDVVRGLPKVVRKVARAARDKYQGQEFAMADLGELLQVGSRTLIPTFNSLERRGLFKKVGQGKRNGQVVNLYRLGKPLTKSA